MPTDRINVTKSTPTTEFVLEADRLSQSASGNYTIVRIYLVAINRGNTSSWSGYTGLQRAGVDGIDSDVGTYSANPFLPSGVGTGVLRWRKGPYDVKIPHSSNGTRGAITLRMTLRYGNGAVNTQHTASFNDFPTISVSDPANPAGAPSAPISKTPTAITHTGMTFDFDDGANNGSAITVREYQYSTTSAFTGATVIAAPSNGTITRTDLTPGTKYYWRARTKNAKGTSAWSTVREATTLPGVLVKVGGEWKVAIPYVKDAGVWKPAVPYVKTAGVWKIGSN